MKKITKLLFVCILSLSSLIALFSFNKARVEVNALDSTYEEADIISVNDLIYQGTYQNGKIDLLDMRVYEYKSETTYGSIIFKAIFNFKSQSFTNGDLQGSQFRFEDGWDTTQMVWFNPIGTLMNDSNGEYIFGSILPTNTDCEVEIGRLAIMNGDKFSGEHYFYVKLNGVVAAEKNITLSDAQLNKKQIFMTGKSGNETNEIKNFEIKKTVTLKVLDSSKDVDVIRSSYLTIPEFDTTTLPIDKMIKNWKIEGTDTIFNPENERIIKDITLVATVEDFKWKVTFGDDDYYFKPTEEITLPLENPTKDYTNSKHYVFDCWVDSEGAEFTGGVMPTSEMTFTAKFIEEEHSFSEFVVTTEPLCDTDGEKTKTCSCGYEITESVPMCHYLVHQDKVNETCTKDGHIEYYHCSKCDKNFADELGKKELDDIIISKHGLIHHDEVAGTCTKTGNIEYYECITCHKYYSDERGTIEIESIVTPKVHEIIYYNRVDATCEEDGHIAYYHCKNCGKNFSDIDCEHIIGDIIIPAKEHDYYSYGVCKVCGNKDPYYVAEQLDSGCKSSISLSIIGSISLIGCILIIKRRKEEL